MGIEAIVDFRGANNMQNMCFIINKIAFCEANGDDQCSFQKPNVFEQPKPFVNKNDERELLRPCVYEEYGHCHNVEAIYQSVKKDKNILQNIISEREKNYYQEEENGNA